MSLAKQAREDSYKSIRFSEALELFVEYLHSVDKSQFTVETYRGHLSRINEYLYTKFNCPIYLDEVVPDEIEHYIYESEHSRNFSPVTRQGITNAFKCFYTFCYKRGYCKENIGKHIILIRAKPKERTFITEDEMKKIVCSMKIEAYKALIQTLFYAGLRIGEALNLTFDDLNFQENYIYVRKHKSRDNRKVPINYKLKAVLEDYLKHGRVDTDEDNNMVFTLNRIKSTSLANFSRELNKAVEKAGLNLKISSHIMRHSFASILITKGVNVVQVQKLLGHRSLHTTSIYLHTNMAALKKAVNTL